jgi:hypothetical protein
MKKLIAVWMLMIAGSTFGQIASGDVIGTIVSGKNNQPIIGAKTLILDNGRRYQGISDEDGRFRMTSIPSGKYTMLIYYLGDTMSNIQVDVPIEAYCNLGTVEFESKIVSHKGIKFTPKATIKFGEIPVQEITAMEIKRSPVKFDVKSLVTTMSSEVKLSEDGELMFRGARKGDMIYVLDGIKSNEVFNVPSCSIARMMVYTGGLPAKYGDTLGGAVILETKSYFDLYRQWQAENGE